MKQILFLIVFSIGLFWVVHNLSALASLAGQLLSLLSPFLLGFAFAFLLNLLLCPLERLWDRLLPASSRKARRPVCIFLSIMILLGILFAIFFILIPQLSRTFSTLAEQLPGYVAKASGWWNTATAALEGLGVEIPAFQLDADTILTTVRTFFQQIGSTVVDKTLNFTISIFSLLFNGILAFVISLYFLADKEGWKRRVRRLIAWCLPEKKAAGVLRVLSLANTSFTNFITGQLVEAVIIGTLCLLGMLIFRFPNALAVSVMVGFTALIPIFGAWIGAVLGALLILFISPIKALGFLIFLIVLQQVEGNLIYPKVVGKSVGLPGFWVLAAVTIGSGSFGILGMILGVPVCAVIYTLVNAAFEKNQPENEDNSEPATDANL